MMPNTIGSARDYAREERRDGALLGAGSEVLTARPRRRPEPKDVEVGPVVAGLLTNQLLSALPAEEFVRLLPYLEPATLTAGTVLYGLDEEIDYLYFPETTVISHLHLLEDGSSPEALLIGREGVAGLSAIFNAPPPLYLTEVTLAGVALRVRAEVLRQEFACGGALQQLLLGHAGARMAQLAQRVVCNGSHQLEERLCTWLLMVHDRTREDQLALTQEQIARHLGARRAGVTIIARSLKERGIIDYRRGQLRLVNRPAMELAACECYRAMKE